MLVTMGSSLSRSDTEVVHLQPDVEVEGAAEALAAPTREGIIQQSLEGLRGAAKSLKADSAADLHGARGTLHSLEDQATALSGLVRGLGPDFTQGDWSPLVETIHDATTMAHGKVEAFLKQTGRARTSPHLLDLVFKAAAALQTLREEATLLASRGSWSV